MRKAVAMVLLLAVLLGFVACDKSYVSQYDQNALLGYVFVTGESMQPSFPSNVFVVAHFGVPYEELKAGDTVIFWDYTRGGYNHHRLIQKQGAYWIARGDNPKTNTQADRAFVTRDNYMCRTEPIYYNKLP